MAQPVINGMGYVSIRTTKFEESISDATEILGLRVTKRTENSVYLSAADVHHELVYHRAAEGEEDGVDHFGLIAPSREALQELRRRVDARGYPIISDSPLEPGVDEGFAFVGPEGFAYAIYLSMEYDRADRVSFGPDRYGHINLHPQDVEAYKDFLVEVLDFKISDIIGDDFAYFLRCNPDHHGIAIIKGRGTLHHHAWQTQSIADIGKLGDRLDQVGRHLIWGPVRHGAGHNIAGYFVEPAGSVIELYTDMEQIYDEMREAARWEADDNRWFNRWGGTYRGENFRSYGLAPAKRD